MGGYTIYLYSSPGHGGHSMADYYWSYYDTYYSKPAKTSWLHEFFSNPTFWWILGGFVVAIGLFFLIRFIVRQVQDNRSYNSYSEKKEKKVFTMGSDFGTYILLALSEIATVVYSLVTKTNYWIIFIPLVVGILYNLIIKIIGASMLVKSCKSNVNIEDLKKLINNLK